MLEMSRPGDINGNILYSVRNPLGKYLSVPRGWVKGVAEKSRMEGGRKIIRNKNGEKKTGPIRTHENIYTHAIV